MTKFRLLSLIFGALVLSARLGHAAEEPKNPARPTAPTSGIAFDINKSSISASVLTGESTGTIKLPKTKQVPTNPKQATDVTPAPAPVVVQEVPQMTQARVAITMGDWRGARRIALKYLEKNEKSSEAWTVLAKTYFAQKEYKTALKRFDKALKYDPHNAEAFYGKGMAYEAMSKPDEAANEYQAAFRADPDMADAKAAWQRVKDQASSAPQ
jgi:predicted Zn-dependent protease